MTRPGPRNSITDVPGILVGTAEDVALTTGVTVVVPEAPAVCAVDHRGGGIGSRDTVAVMPGSVVSHVHAICLSGGSAYGLDAAGGVMHGLRQEGRGFPVRGEIVPVVPSAIIFDLLTGAPKSWDHPPWWALGLAAFRTAGNEVRLGNAGAGLGATAGPIKGGQGSASFAADDFTVGALVVANPLGLTVIPGTRTFWAWMLEQGGELGGQQPPGKIGDLNDFLPSGPLQNTTLAVVATDAALTREQALRVAIMAQDGIARAIRPVHAPMDGDTVFVLSTAARPFEPNPAELTRLGSLAADCVARAVMRGVCEADALAGVPAYRDLK